MLTIKLLAAAGHWAAGSVLTLNTKQAERLIRTGYAEAVPEEAPMGLTGAKRKPKERTH